MLSDYGDRVPNPEHAIDKQIAAIALLHDLTVVTRNTAVFLGNEVRLLNPCEPSPRPESVHRGIEHGGVVSSASALVH